MHVGVRRRALRHLQRQNAGRPEVCLAVVPDLLYDFRCHPEWRANDRLALLGGLGELAGRRLLHVVDEILGASHPDIEGAIEELLRGYTAEEERLGPPAEQTGGSVPTASEVLQRLENVRTRVRYHG